MAKTPLLPTPGGVWRDALGGIVIESQIAAPPGRQGFERQFFPGIEVGLVGWERAHSQGSGTGFESPYAIRYAPAEVNQEYQRLGVERFIRELFQMKGPAVDLKLTTTTYTHSGSLRLREILYRVDAVRDGKSHTLFEAGLEVEDKRSNPKVIPYVQERTPHDAWPELLK